MKFKTKLYFFKLLILTIIIPINANADRPEPFILNDRYNLEFSIVTENIKNLCPPATCTVIAIGRSPTPFVAKLHSEGLTNYAINLPLSSFRYGEREAALESSQEKILFDHFDRYINPQKLKNQLL